MSHPGEVSTVLREQVKKFIEGDFKVYGLGVGDYAYTVRLAKEYVTAKMKLYEQYAERIRKEQPESADDILDDAAYYNCTETEYAWHFCLWRLQGIFEGIIVQRIIPGQDAERLPGLKAKLDAVRRAGYPLDDEDYDELLSWAKLRNVLSHIPPEQYRPGPLCEGDIMDYLALVERITKRWLKLVGTDSTEE
jgi:hypothetical protein